MASLLTREEAMSYVELQLGISDCNSLLQTHKYKLLCLLTRAMHEKVPFHNLCLMAEEPKNRKRPDWKKIKEDMISGIGGLCYTKNYFTLHLLRALGYEVKALLGHVNQPNNHYLLMAFNVKTVGDKFLIDVGVGLPQFDPVDMNFERETPVMIQSFLLLKLVKQDKRVVRMQKERDGNGSLEGFGEFFDFTLDYYEPGELDHFFDKVYEIPKTSPFHRILCCMVYPEGRAKYLLNGKLKVENNSGCLDDIILNSDRVIVEAITQNFPAIPVDIVRRAVVNWKHMNNGDDVDCLLELL